MNKSILSAIALILAGSHSFAFAGFSLVGPVNYSPSAVDVVYPDYSQFWSRLGNFQHIDTPSNDFKNLLATRYSGWTFNYVPGSASGSLSGTLRVDWYYPWVHGPGDEDPNIGGAHLDATYTRGANDPSLSSLEFVQFITTTSPAKGQSSPYVDSVANNFATPFYNDPQEELEYKIFGPPDTYQFLDSPSRPKPDLFSSTDWQADLFLASSPTTGVVTIYDGLEWGFRISTTHGGPMIAVPEPTGLAILASGIVAMILALCWKRSTGSRRIMAGLAFLMLPCFVLGSISVPERGPDEPGRDGANAEAVGNRPSIGTASMQVEGALRYPTDTVVMPTATPEPVSTTPLVYKDQRTGTLFYVESDRRHVSAIDAGGNVLWCRDPFRESGIQPYRFKEPFIVYIGDAGGSAAGDETAGAGAGPYLGLCYNSSQFGNLDMNTGKFTFRGRD